MEYCRAWWAALAKPHTGPLMPEQPSVTLGLPVILVPPPAWETIPSGFALTPLGTFTLTGVGDQTPTGDTGSSHPEPPPARTAALYLAPGTETACFRLFPEDIVVATTSPSAVTLHRAPRLGGDWSPVCWPLVCTIASTRISSLSQHVAAKRDLVTHGKLTQRYLR